MILCSEYGGQPNTIICSFVCDSVDEVKDLPTTKKLGSGSFSDFNHYANIGSTVTIGNNGTTKIMMLFSSGWQEV
mgnify:FL=1|uniref:Uncharacterized protein n=1 Tax=Siphoviridae sp. ctENB54 TaxID=2827815 RepID=A0A8S5TDG0_9CAUD|nr:MAG TPA: hypothetical protein [Siphoviridae sp. ctENB54]